MKKVIVGMSGGVDSAVAAYLLQKQGYEVIGLFMRNWDTSVNGDYLGNPDLNNDICPQEQDYNDAVEVCKKLNIPLHRVDFVKEYWNYVFTYFVALPDPIFFRNPSSQSFLSDASTDELFISGQSSIISLFVKSAIFCSLARFTRSYADNFSPNKLTRSSKSL